MAYLSDFVISSNGVFSVKTVANVATGDVVALTDFGVRPIHPNWPLVEGTNSNGVFLNINAYAANVGGILTVNTASAALANASTIGYCSSVATTGGYNFNPSDVITTSSFTLANGVTIMSYMNSSSISLISVGPDNLQITNTTVATANVTTTNGSYSSLVQLSANTLAVAYYNVSAGANVIVKTYTTDFQPLNTIYTAVNTSVTAPSGFPFAFVSNTSTGLWALFGKSTVSTTNATLHIGNSSSIIVSNTGIALSGGLVACNNYVGIPCLNGDFAFGITDGTYTSLSRHTSAGVAVFTANVGSQGVMYPPYSGKRWLIEFANSLILLPNTATPIVCNGTTGAVTGSFTLPTVPLATCTFGSNLYITGCNNTTNVFLSSVNSSFGVTTVTNTLFPTTNFGGNTTASKSNSMFLSVNGMGATIVCPMTYTYYDGTNNNYYGAVVMMQANTSTGTLITANVVQTVISGSPPTYIGSNYWQLAGANGAPAEGSSASTSYLPKSVVAVSGSPDGSFVSLFTETYGGSGPAGQIFSFTWKPLKSGVFGSALTSNTSGGNVNIQTAGGIGVPNVTLVKSGQFDHTNNGVAGNKGILAPGFGYLKGLA